MPDAARSLGRSMRILKAEVSNMHDDEKPDAATPAPAPAQVLPSSHQQQIEQLQQQVRDLQQQASGLNGTAPAPAEAQHSQQSS
jgi:sec-independent protein translocase protein TatA